MKKELTKLADKIYNIDNEQDIIALIKNKANELSVDFLELRLKVQNEYYEKYERGNVKVVAYGCGNVN